MSTKPRILLAWELGGALGHVTKFMLLAERLQAHGFEIWVASQNLTSAESVLRPLGVRLVQSPVWMAGPGNIPEPINYAGILARKGWLSADGLTGLARGWRDLVEAIAPRLIVANHAPSLLLGLRGGDVPVVFADSPFGMPPLAQPFPNMRYWQGSELLPLMHDVEARVLATANLALASLRMTPLQYLSDLFQNVATCLLGLPALDHYPERGQSDYFGPLYAQNWGDLPVWPDGQGKRIFVYLNCRHAMFEPVLNQLAKMPCRVLAYAVDLPDDLAAKLTKPNIALRTRPQHMAAVLGSADWVIHHAGNGLASQALLAGVPLLMLPNHLEQSMFAVRVGELRAGKVLPNDARLIGAALQQALTDEGFAERARRFAEQHASYSVSATLDRLVALCLAKIDAAS
jgi:UDP:flavonoid glycosyltransferase YjiC (YdhE family)